MGYHFSPVLGHHNRPTRSHSWWIFNDGRRSPRHPDRGVTRKTISCYIKFGYPHTNPLSHPSIYLSTRTALTVMHVSWSQLAKSYLLQLIEVCGMGRILCASGTGNRQDLFAPRRPKRAATTKGAPDCSSNSSETIRNLIQVIVSVWQSGPAISESLWSRNT